MSSMTKYVGFVIDGLVPSLRRCLKHRTISPIFRGWPSASSISEARYRPIAERVNQKRGPLLYELYRSWRKYDVVVFLKSMNGASLHLAKRLRAKTCRVIFDLNIDYLTPATGTVYYDGMAPSAQQREQALEMINLSDAVIADSLWIAEIAKGYCDSISWIPDCVSDDMIFDGGTWTPAGGTPLTLFWSGEAVKMFELIRIETVLRALRDKVHLCLVTNSLTAIEKIYQPWRGRLMQLLSEVSVEIIDFRDLRGLMKIYDRGGVCISPRFLDNSYNMGHTEWKISLAMARGRMVLCSPQPSYLTMRERSKGLGIRVCDTDDEWVRAIEEILSPGFDWQREQRAACETVMTYYSAPIVAKAHEHLVNHVLS